MRELNDVLRVIEDTIVAKQEHIEWELKNDPYDTEVHCTKAQIGALREVQEYARKVYGWSGYIPELDGRYGGDPTDTESYSMYRELMND